MEKIACPICDAEDFTFVLRGRDNLHNIEGDFDVVRCVRCDLMITNPRPDANEIKKYYPDNYGPYVPNFRHAKKMAFLRRRCPWLLKIIDPIATLDLDFKKKANVLEVGCGAGNFLYELKLLHPEWNIKGADFNEKSIDTLRGYGLDVFVSDLKILKAEGRSVDIIYGWMVVEHIHSINQALSEVYRVLKDDGRFVFSVPNAGSWELGFFGKYWLALHLPNHLYHFTESTISRLLKKNGFEVEKVIHQKTFSNVFLSIKNAVERSSLPLVLKKLVRIVFGWNIIYFFLTLPIATVLAACKQSGYITIIAKKHAK